MHVVAPVSVLIFRHFFYRMYQDKLAQLKKQLQQLQEGTLPEYLRRLKRIEQQYKERLRLNDTWQACCVCIRHVFVIFELCTVSDISPFLVFRYVRLRT